MSSKEKIHFLIDKLQKINYKKIELFLSLCESEIEKLFLLNFICYYESRYKEMDTQTLLFDPTDINDVGGTILEKNRHGFSMVTVILFHLK